jgi:hypothetical protein
LLLLASHTSLDIARASIIRVNLPEIPFQVDKSNFYTEFVVMKCAFLRILVEMMAKKRGFSLLPSEAHPPHRYFMR